MRETTEAMTATRRGFPYPDLSKAPPDVQAAYASLPAKIDLFRMLAHSSGTFVPFMHFTNALFKKLALAKKNYELMVLFTAHRCACEYEWRQHIGTAPKVGVRPEQIAAIENNQLGDVNVFSEPERLLFRMGTELLDNIELSPTTLAEGLRVFSPPQVIEISLIVGLYRALAGMIRSVDLDFNPDEAAKLVAAM